MAARVVVVTGASSGLGRAVADRLHTDGWTVVGASRRATGGNGWTPLRMDVDDDASVAAGMAEVAARHGRIDAVVAAAGWGLAGAVEHTTLDRAKAQFETNFWGAVRATNAVLPTMRAQGGGRMVLISSIGGVVALPFQAYYSAGKFAMEGWAEALAYEVEPFGIEVTLVQPGNFRTGFTDLRETVAGGADDPYEPRASKVIAQMAREEAEGADPAKVAARVAEVLVRRRPPRRVSVGKAAERFGVVGKRFMPFRMFERAAKSSLGA